MAFDFSLIFSKWSARRYYKAIKQWYKQIPARGWPCHVLSNHDLHRSFNRYGIARDKMEKARIAAVLLLSLKGTPFLYYGEEIGMENIKLKRRDINDPIGKKYWPIYSGRDQARTPMQWSDKPHGGFTIGSPWLKVNPGYQTKNVAAQLKDENSLLNTYRRLIQIRHLYPSLQYGSWNPIQKGLMGVLSYFRSYQGERLLVALNFTTRKKTIELNGPGPWHVIFSTNHQKQEDLLVGKYKLEPYEAIILSAITSDNDPK